MRKRINLLNNAFFVRRFSPIDNNLISNKGSGASSQDQAHPSLYHVPVTAARVVGREAEVLNIWQNVLSGRHCQVVVGVDGVGKSTIVAEFCDRARRAQKFSCIQWFNAKNGIDSQLSEFFKSMQGRKERDVLLVFDDVSDPNAILSLVPDHKNVFVLMTSNRSDLQGSNKMHIVEAGPFSEKNAASLLTEKDPDSSVLEAFDYLGNVPLLVHIATCLLESDILSSFQLIDLLRSKEVKKNNVLSVSAAASVLLDVSVGEMSKKYPKAAEKLCILSSFHIADISDPVVGAVVGEEGADFAVMAAQLGIFSLKWEDSAFAIHPTVAAVLRAGANKDILEQAAQCLHTLWPKRARGIGSHFAYNLVWHTLTVSSHFVECSIPLSISMQQSMDKSATFLSQNELRDLPVAANMWYQVYKQNFDQKNISPDSCRIARECGRLLHFLRDERAKEVLENAYEMATSFYGKQSPETGFIMSFLAPYLDASDRAVDSISHSIASLNELVHSNDVVLSKEELKMNLESIFVLLLRKGQMFEEMKKEVPNDLWDSLEKVKGEIRRNS